MTRIDFYFNAPDKLGVAAKLAQKAYASKVRLLIFTRDARALDDLDKRLWVLPATGFLPHCRASDPAAGETPVLLTAENHSVIGGLGSAVAEVLALAGVSTKFAMVGVRDVFAEGGTTPYLMQKYGLTGQHIADQALALHRRQGA